MTEVTISKLKDRIIEFTQSEQHRENSVEKLMNISSGTCGGSNQKSRISLIKTRKGDLKNRRFEESEI